MFAESHDDLYRKRGFPVPTTNPLPPPPNFGFLIRKTPGAFWVAEDEGKIVGYSDSFVRGTFWYFAWLFVLPGYQGRDIGRHLLERTLASWKGVKITNRATITFAFNPVSQFLYMKYGMYPREPVYYAEAPREKVRKIPPDATDLEYDELTKLREGAAVLEGVDRSVLGFSLGWHHEFFFEAGARCYVFRRHGDPVGYAYVHPNGRVGPVAVNRSSYMGPALRVGLGLSAAQEAEKVWYWMPGSNVQAVELALKYKMQIDPGVFMSARPFAKWGNYIFHSAAMM